MYITKIIKQRQLYHDLSTKFLKLLSSLSLKASVEVFKQNLTL